MTQQEFNTLSKRYLEGKTTEEEDLLLMKWNHAQDNQNRLNLPPDQKKAIEKRIWGKLQQQIQPRPRGLVRHLAWVAGIAACLVLGIAWYSSVYSAQKEDASAAIDTNHEQKGIEVKNTTPLEQKIKLEDGTTVLLKQNSAIVYDRSFNRSKREIYLEGEAFFKVKRDISKPFIVHTGALVTEVLGTSFRVKSFDNAKTIEVMVASGKVSVYTEKASRRAERNGVILTPNQRVVYDVNSRNIVPSIVDNPQPIATPGTAAPQLDFQEASLQSVLNALTELYGIEFVISNPVTKACRITADLNGLSMATQLKLICKSMDATYEKRGTVVFINGDGC